jgi:hypothetical protein
LPQAGAGRTEDRGPLRVRRSMSPELIFVVLRWCAREVITALRSPAVALPYGGSLLSAGIVVGYLVAK